MLMVISPAKRLDFDSQAPFKGPEQPYFKNECLGIVKELKTFGSKKLGSLMKLSVPLSELNESRYKTFKNTFSEKNSKMALYAFRGDTYIGFDADSLNKKEFEYAKKKLRILSGLYGLLCPHTLIQPYRLEMGTRFGPMGTKNLYEYWKEKLTDKLNEEAHKTKEKYLVNLASVEYFKALDTKKLDLNIITPIFKENKDGGLKTIGLFSKKARGMMARFIVENKASTLSDLKKFNYDGYKFNSGLSSDGEIVFVR